MADQSFPAAPSCAGAPAAGPGAEAAGPDAVSAGERRESGLCYARLCATDAAAARAPAAQRVRRPPAWAAVCVLAVITGLALAGVLTTTGGWDTSADDAEQAGYRDQAGAAPPRPAALTPVPTSATDLVGAASERSIGPAGRTAKPSASATAAPALGEPLRTASPPPPASGGPGRAGSHGPGTGGGAPSGDGPPGAYCTARYTLDGQWPGGFRAHVALTAREPLDGWSIEWTFRDGQRVTAMWNGTFRQDGAAVTVTAAHYDRSVAAGTSFGVGFLGAGGVRDTGPGALTLNGHRCQP